MEKNRPKRKDLEKLPQNEEPSNLLKVVITKIIIAIFACLIFFLPYTYFANHFFWDSGYGEMTSLRYYFMDNFGISPSITRDLDFSNFTGSSGLVVFLLEFITFFIIVFAILRSEIGIILSSQCPFCENKVGFMFGGRTRDGLPICSECNKKYNS